MLSLLTVTDSHASVERRTSSTSAASCRATQAITSPSITTPLVARIAVAAANVTAAVTILPHPCM